MAHSREPVVAQIALPEAVRADLERLAMSRAALQREMDAIVRTARAALGVPPEFVLPSLEAGFVPPGDEGKSE